MENGYVFGWIVEPIHGLVSKFRSDLWWQLSGLIILWSISPLLINFNSYPPGDDPWRLEMVSNTESWLGYKYLGWLPIRIIGVSLFYYLTPLLSYLGLIYFFGREHKWSALIAMVILYGMLPALYFNLAAGTWISVINFILVGLVTVKTVHQLGITPNSKPLILASIILTFLIPIIHNETGAYISLMILSSIVITRKWKISYLILSTLAGLYITFFMLGGNGDELVLRTLQNQEGFKVIEVTDEFGETHRIHAASIKSGTEVDLAAGKKLILTDSNFKVQNVGFAWWARYMISDLYVPFALLSMSVFLYFYKYHFKFHKPTLMLLTALPVMMFFAWSPWEVSGIRLGIYIAVILGIFHASLLGRVLEYHRDEWLKFTFGIIGGFYFLTGGINTWISWMFMRAS